MNIPIKLNKNDIDDYDLNDNLLELDNDDDLYEDFQIGYTELLRSCNQYINFVINFDEKPIEVWDIWIELEPLSEINEDYLDLLNDCNIHFYCGNINIGKTSLYVNLLLAKYFKKKIYYEDGKIYIPFIMNNMLSKKIPLYMFDDPTICIQLYNMNNDFKGRLKYYYVEKIDKKIDKKLDKIGTFAFSQQKSASFEYYNEFSTNFKQPMIYLIFEISSDEQNNYVDIQSITITLDDNILTYNADEGGITHCDINGQKYYAVSLCPEFTSLEQLCNFCNNKKRKIDKLHCINFKDIKVQDYILNDSGCLEYYNINIYPISIIT